MLDNLRQGALWDASVGPCYVKVRGSHPVSCARTAFSLAVLQVMGPNERKLLTAPLLHVGTTSLPVKWMHRESILANKGNLTANARPPRQRLLTPGDPPDLAWCPGRTCISAPRRPVRNLPTMRTLPPPRPPPPPYTKTEPITPQSGSCSLGGGRGWVKLLS